MKKNLKVCFIGIGSIAKRHIKNLREIAEEKGFDIHIDALRRGTGYYTGIEKIYNKFDDIPSDYDAIFITNPTDQHLHTLQHVHDKSKNFFIEKPVVDVSQIDLAEMFNLRKNSVYYVACPLRYNAVIRYIREYVDINDVIAVRSISSSYLPDWRPGQDYRDTYSAHKNRGGGVSIDLIHEWDYLIDLFGWPKQVKSMMGKLSDLEIDSEDYAVYIAEYEKMILELHLDYFGRKTVREIQLFCKEDTIIGDIENQTIHFLKEGRMIEFKENRDDFQKRELNCFIDMVFGERVDNKMFRNSINVLKISQGNLVHVL